MIQQSDDLVDDVTLYFKGTGDFPACRAAVIPLLNLTVPCQKFMCSMNGVFQPDINFHNSEFFGFSEFWYTTEDVFRMAGPYNSDKFVGAAKNYCNTEWSTLMDWYERKLYPKADQQRFRLQCFKSAWIHAVLHDGFKFPTTYTNFRSAQLVNGKDVQWTLGALIYRTRFIPLREIEKHEASVEAVPVKRSSVFYPEYVIVFCFCVVFMAIILYVRRLNLCPSKRAAMSRVPSMTYFMTEIDQSQPGLEYVSGYGYSA